MVGGHAADHAAVAHSSERACLDQRPHDEAGPQGLHVPGRRIHLGASRPRGLPGEGASCTTMHLLAAAPFRAAAVALYAIEPPQM